MSAQSAEGPARKPKRRWVRYLLYGLATVAVVLVIRALVVSYIIRYGPYLPELPASSLTVSYDGNSHELKSTQIVPTLDTPVEPGKNVVWCASFVAAWKKLQNDLAGGPVVLSGAPAACDRLNAANDPGESIPEGALYATAGWAAKGIIETIGSEMKQRFPDSDLPRFPGIAVDSFVAFAHMEANAKFALPFFDNREALLFRDNTDTRTRVRSFGIRERDANKYPELRDQVNILWNKWSKESHEWILDLCVGSDPSQVIVASIEPKATLAETIAYSEECIGRRVGSDVRPLEMEGILLVPDFLWEIEHHFAELEKKKFANAPLTNREIHVAQQDITFRLDRSGAELKSEARVYYLGSLSEPIEAYYFIADHPFLVYMKMRDAAEPYFVMWVDNAELLQKW